MGLGVPATAEALGVREVMVHQWELGVFLPTQTQAKHLAALFDVSPSSVLARWEIAYLSQEEDNPWLLEETPAVRSCPCRSFCLRPCHGLAGCGILNETTDRVQCPRLQDRALATEANPALCHP